jgi:hypothetical protein
VFSARGNRLTYGKIVYFGLDNGAGAAIAARVGIAPLFDLQAQLSPGILVYPTELDDSVMYVMFSESADDAKVDLRDRTTGVRLALPILSQHAAIAVIGKKQKAVVAKYGF